MKKRKTKIVRRIDRSSLKVSNVARALSKALGSEAVHTGAESDQGEPRCFVPSGVPELDLVLDREGRGWPMGRIVEVFGAEATCKTGLGYALIAEVQKAGGTAVLFPVEGNVDRWLAEQYGIDFGNLIIADDETVEKVFEGIVVSMRAAGNRGLLVIVIDSIAALTTDAELKDETITRDRQAQVRALLISKALRKLGAKVPRTNCLIFCINQVRDNPDAMFGDKTKPPGGRALKFYASVRLKLEAIQKVKRQREGKTRVAGFKLKITAIKNRLARPYQDATIMLDFDKGLLPVNETKRRKRREL